MRFIPPTDNHGSDVQPLHTGPSFSHEQAREVFREMVRAEARGNMISKLRRKRVIQYAAALNLTSAEAGKIVTEVYLERGVPFGGDGAESPALYRLVEASATPERWPAWLQITAAMTAGFVILAVVRQLL